MDLVYIPEVFTYGSFRSPQYRDYEQPWNKDYFSCKKSNQSQPVSQRQTVQQPVQVLKESCHLCRETKRRRLAAYIRSKSRSDSCHGINEEDEEEEKEEKNATGSEKNSKQNKSGNLPHNVEQK